MLERYKGKRDFSRTPEPGPIPIPTSWGGLRFVVQKHAASRLHYDFRLELDGVLKSWAIPKGPSLNPQERRLAVLVEDHPLDYASFEGVIADGNYGAGQVIVWDTGIYSPDEEGLLSFAERDEAQERMRRAWETGKLSITLRGRKLKGSWTLVRTSRTPKDWLLIKHKDSYVNAERDVLQEERSVLSSLTVEDLKSGHLPDRPALPGKKAPFPTRLMPMLAHVAEQPFSHPDWLFEPKLDGFRVLAFVRRGQAALRSRNETDLTAVFPEIASELSALPEEELVLDGEVVALDERGLPDFQLLQQRTGFTEKLHAPRRSNGAIRVVYYPFDLLYLNGMDLRRASLAERKKVLAQVLVPGDYVKSMDYVDGDGESFFRAAQQMGLEGMVAKHRDGAYEPGVRSKSWLKVKGIHEQEFLIAGYTRGEGARSETFGALLLAYYQGGDLRYAGRVGSGFDESSLDELWRLLQPLAVERLPFAEAPSDLEGVEVRWVRPELVARVKFTQWTEGERLRAPVFNGLRSDVEPTAVGRETANVVSVPPLPAKNAEREGLAAEVDEVLRQLSGASDTLLLRLPGHRMSLTNLNKELWPGDRDHPPVTKRDMVRYYARMAPLLLPHLRDRPLALTRYPDGIYGESFYQKHWEHKVPEFVDTVRLFSSHNEGDVEYVVVNNLSTLLWLAQLANIEFHPWLSRTALEPDAAHLPATFAGSEEAIDQSVLNYPDFIVFDLDPYIYSGEEKPGGEPELNRRGFAKVVEVAKSLKEVLDQLSLSSFLKTSGKSGLHIYVPILRQYDYGTTRKTCEIIGRFLMQQRPRDITMEWTVSKRTGKIFLDHKQNMMGKNMASAYSLRPVQGATVSTPVRWEELDAIYPTDFTVQSVPARLETLGDLWADILRSKHDLRRLLQASG